MRARTVADKTTVSSLFLFHEIKGEVGKAFDALSKYVMVS